MARPHEWTVEEVDAAAIGPTDFYRCKVCEAHGGPVLGLVNVDGKPKPPPTLRPFVVMGYLHHHVSATDCDLAKAEAEAARVEQEERERERAKTKKTPGTRSIAAYFDDDHKIGVHLTAPEDLPPQPTDLPAACGISFKHPKAHGVYQFMLSAEQARAFGEKLLTFAEEFES